MEYPLKNGLNTKHVREFVGNSKIIKLSKLMISCVRVKKLGFRCSIRQQIVAFSRYVKCSSSALSVQIPDKNCLPVCPEIDKCMFAKFVWMSIQGGRKGQWIWDVEGVQRFGFELFFDFKM
jgi:hypothetical protein